MKNNTQLKIKLRKCAYIFNDTYSTYTTTRDRDRKAAIQKTLKEFYDNADKRAEWLDAEEKTITTYNGQEIKRIYATINGQEIPLNALEIAETNRADDIHNHRRRKTLCGLDAKKFDLHAYADNTRAYSRKFKTIEIEEFTGADTLGYFRLHFRGAYVCFIIDDRSGDIFNAHGIEHTKTTRAAILERLDAKSKEARAEINAILDYLQN